MFFSVIVEFFSFFTNIPKLCFFLALGLSIYNQYKTRWNLFGLIFFTIVGFTLFYFSIIIYQVGYEMFIECFIDKSRVLDFKFIFYFLGIFCFLYFLTLVCIFYISFILDYEEAFSLIMKIGYFSLNLILLPIVLIVFEVVLLGVLYGFYTDPSTFNIIVFIFSSIFCLILGFVILGYFSAVIETLKRIYKKKEH